MTLVMRTENKKALAAPGECSGAGLPRCVKNKM